MANILVAASAAPSVVVQRILAGHELSCAQTMGQAERLLSERTFDLIICTLVFDESRMFDLLRLVKSKPDWAKVPFVGARVRADVLRSPSTMKAAALTCLELGAAAFLDIANYTVDRESQMRDAIEGFLAPAAGA